ncbi:MAG: deoxyribodipyrimidine photo-lyase [Planctomycetota bacterium]|nr:deoxyribodipyrimidine photo-lyase [Planctomycetota bacterium]
MRALVWFRSDLRVRDNPALHRACAEADSGVVGVFLICPKQWREHDWADAKVDFLLRTLEALSGELEKLNIPLLIRTVPTFRGAPKELFDAAHRHECDALYYNAEYEVNEQRRDEAVRNKFERADVGVRIHHDQAIVRPDAPRTSSDSFYTVFTPFKRSWMKHLDESGIPEPLGRPKRQPEMIAQGDEVPSSVDGFDAADMSDLWPAGEDAARRRLRRFVQGDVSHYKSKRDVPADDITSRLSTYLALGAVSARQCLAAALDVNAGRLDGGRPGPATWISQLVWRDFFRHVLVGFPRVSMHRPFRPETDAVKWRDDDAQFRAWCEGRTGVPIVDAGMRQLKETGWMHNRLRMIAAMFLSKDLLLDWRLGERHFMRHLIDGDLANNNGGWQWSASTGTDAAPYFRIFNPFTQSRRFDSSGAFIRAYVPELADLDEKTIHEPHKLPDDERAAIDYPDPIVDHAAGRDRAIAAFKALRG